MAIETYKLIIIIDTAPLNLSSLLQLVIDPISIESEPFFVQNHLTWVVSLLMGIAVSLFLILLGLDPAHDFILNWELDGLTFLQKRSKIQTSPSPITLITIDSKTAANKTYLELFGSLYNRRSYGYLIRYLNQAQAKSVGLDISFNGGKVPQSKADSQYLVQAVDQSLIPVASQFIFENEKHPIPIDLVTQGLIRQRAVSLKTVSNRLEKVGFNSIAPPYLALLKSKMNFYASSIRKPEQSSGIGYDAQSLIRSWIPFFCYNGQLYPSFPLGILLNTQKNISLDNNGQLSWMGGKVQLGGHLESIIHWYGHGVDIDSPVYPEFSIADVVLTQLQEDCAIEPNHAFTLCSKIQNTKITPVPKALFKNQYVLVGNTLTNVDEHPTIYGPKYPGVYIVANILHNILRNGFIQPAPSWLNYALLLLLPGGVAGIVWRYRSIPLTLLLTIALCVGYLSLTVYAYQHWKLWIYTVSPILAGLVTYSGLYLWRYVQERKAKDKMRYAFGKYVSPAVLKLISENPEQVKLGGSKREMTFLFSDIRGFTSFSDQNPPEAVQAFLTQYFSTMNRIIMHTYQGSINKLIGDAIMAYWGFPLDNEDHAYLAVSAALAMQEAMLAWREQENMLPIHIGIGINTGEAMVGNVGSEDFMDFTVIGDAVNVASRLEGLNKEYATHIIISKATYERVKDRIEARPLGWASIKGKEEKVEIFEPLGFLPGTSAPTGYV